MPNIFCKVCGGNKTLHSSDLWRVHKRMHEEYDKLRREYERYCRRARKIRTGK